MQYEKGGLDDMWVLQLSWIFTMRIIMGRQPTQPVEAFRPGQDLRPLCLSPPPPEEGLKVLKTFIATFKTGYMEVFEDFFFLQLGT